MNDQTLRADGPLYIARDPSVPLTRWRPLQ